jgi:DUF1365 family protein
VDKILEDGASIIDKHGHSASQKLNSAIYSGTVWHQRLSPKRHAFNYRVFMMYLDLAELDQVFAGSILWSSKQWSPARFKRTDFFGDPEISLDDTVRDSVEQVTGKRPLGPIRLLANIRYWGFVINPISCYYCFDSSGTRLETMLLDVTNTPWNERQQYVLPCDSQLNEQKISFTKAMHVSPFMPMNMTYQWCGSAPDEKLAFSLSNFLTDSIKGSDLSSTSIGNRKVFAAGVNFQREEITPAALTMILWRFPLMTLKVFFGIHWQALKLWLKGLKVFTHPPHSR